MKQFEYMHCDVPPGVELREWRRTRRHRRQRRFRLPRLHLTRGA